jgi:hypothetical protein
VAIETLNYSVLEKEGNFEIRDYDSYVVFEVTVSSGFDSALQQGFRVLADYIFGNNRKKQHISMTSPVIQSRTESERIEMTTPVLAQKYEGNKYLVSFVAPKEYTLETLPEPVSSDIHFRTMKAHRAAVIRFSGYLSNQTANIKTRELKNWLKKKRLEARGDFISCQYNPPWILGIFRRNEIMVRI